MAALVRVKAKRIRESPILNVLQRRALRPTEQDSILPKTRVMHVAFFRRDIEIAAKQDRNLIVRALGFLKAENIGLGLVQPPCDERQASDNRVNVPGGDFHIYVSAPAERSGNCALGVDVR